MLCVWKYEAKNIMKRSLFSLESLGVESSNNNFTI